ncbi:hypothetical protein DET54_109147 [Paenibacillus pabuli]|uniref:Uncharacterized protein n=1 Tax=Paenibacillus pabuli TaxID=1472 RepID=A0A855Y0N2_9BACL|nr:hypothetical protein DET56_101106 [Paenibacillus pabuli]PXW11242.1 hypothetical protein DEU73_101105 [Paenibacillus taichungensis]RAI93691.1 hypothetical protein DET54_109147 [Paenibacillus pabuli]
MYLIVIMLIIVITGCDSSTDLTNKENTKTNESSTNESVEMRRAMKSGPHIITADSASVLVVILDV